MPHFHENVVLVAFEFSSLMYTAQLIDFCVINIAHVGHAPGDFILVSSDCIDLILCGEFVECQPLLERHLFQVSTQLRLIISERSEMSIMHSSHLVGTWVSHNVRKCILATEATTTATHPVT